MLKRGGNAVDAAVAVGFAMAVTYPRAGNIGGGGFMVIHLAGSKQKPRRTSPSTIARPRRRRPRATSSSTRRARPIRRSRASRGSPSACRAPSRGWRWRTRNTAPGKFTLAQLIAPAIELARDGFQVGDEFEDTGRSSIARMARWPSTAKLFLKPDGSLIERGTLLVQADLADTLEAIAKHGPRAFYEGPIADKISAAVREAGGLMTSDDLKNYRAVERPVLRGTLSRLLTSSRCRRRPPAACC